MKNSVADWERLCVPTVPDVKSKRRLVVEKDLDDCYHFEESSAEEPVVLRISVSSPGKKKLETNRSRVDKEDVENEASRPVKVALESASVSEKSTGSVIASAFPSLPISAVFAESSPVLDDLEPLILSPFRKSLSNSDSLNGSAKKPTKKKKSEKKSSAKKSKRSRDQSKRESAVADEERRRLEKLHFREMNARLESSLKRHRKVVEEKEEEEQQQQATVVAAAEVLSLDVPSPPPVAAMESLYQMGRRLLQSRNELIGREKESAQVDSFVRECLAGKRGGACYISGPSGVGKSLTVGRVVARVAEEKLCRSHLTINLASEKMSCLLTRVAEEFAPKRLQEGEGKTKARFVVEEACRSRSLVLVLEEVDQRQHVKAVCELFAIANKTQGSQLVLIGIGNNRSFVAENKLQTSLSLTFAAYSADDLVRIVSDKLSAEVCSQLMDSNALKLWASKVAEHLGDMRSATSCLVKAIDIAEAEYLSKPQGSDPVKVGLRAIKTLIDGWGSTRDVLSNISGLAPNARILLIGLAKDASAAEFGDADVRRVFCTLFQQDRPDPGVLRELVASLLDTPFFVQDTNTGKYCVKLDPAVVEQAIASDVALTAFVK